MSPASAPLGLRVRSVRRHLERRAWVAGALWAIAALALALVVVWLMAGAGGWRSGSDLPVVIDAILLAGSVSAAFALARGIRRGFADVPLAGAMEEAGGLREGELRGSLELLTETPPGASRALAHRAASQLASSLEGRDDDELAGRIGRGLTRWTRRGALCAGALVAATATLALVAPERSSLAWTPLANPLATARDPDVAELSLSPGDAEVMRGSSVEVVLWASGRSGAAELHWQAEGEVARSAVLRLDDSGRAKHVFESVDAPLRYRAKTSDGSETPTYIITPVDPLFMGDVRILLLYPAHTGLEAEQVAADAGSLVLPEGTRLEFTGSGSRDFGEVAMVDSAGVPVAAMRVEGMNFEGSWTPRVDGTFTWRAADAEGGDAAIVPPPLTVVLAPDRLPEVRIPFPGRDALISPDLRQQLVIEASDDYGLVRLELIAYRVTALGERRDPTVTTVAAGGARMVAARPILDLRPWGLMPNDTLKYRARAVDGSPNGQASESMEYALVMPASAEMQRMAERGIAEVGDQLAELTDELAREALENRNQARRAEAASDGRSDGDEFADREEMLDALNDQRRLSEELDSLRGHLADLENLMRETGEAIPGLTDELSDLQELLRDTQMGDLQRRMDELAAELDGDDLRRATDQLDALAEDQEALRERLEESLERFRRAAIEQDFRATTEEAAELARQEDALADALREGDRPAERARQQADLEQRAVDLSDRVETLAERLGEVGEEEARAGVREAERSLSESRQGMEEARARAERGETAEAAESADGAQQALEEVARQLADAQQRMMQAAADRVRAALETAADDALSLARRQSELRSSMIGSDPAEVASMRVDEASILEGSENLAENLVLASEGAIPAGAGVNEQTGRVIDAVRRTLATMEVRRGGASQPQVAAEAAVNELNLLSLLAQMAAAQLGRGGSGADDLSEQLEELAQQQGELLNQAGEMMPLQLGEEAMAQQMQNMALGQESIADDLGELATDPSSDEALGDLERMAEEAAEIAEELADANRLTPETARRQERLFHRLLDAGRSLEREEYSDERESEEPGSFERPPVGPLSPEQMGVSRFGGPDPEAMRALPPTVRKLVISYFERLNRQPGGA